MIEFLKYKDMTDTEKEFIKDWYVLNNEELDLKYPYLTNKYYFKNNRKVI